MVDARGRGARRGGKLAGSRPKANEEGPWSAGSGRMTPRDRTTQRPFANVFPVDPPANPGSSQPTSLGDPRRSREAGRGLKEATVLVWGRRCGTNTLANGGDDTTRGEAAHMAIDSLSISCDGLSFQHGSRRRYREAAPLKRARFSNTPQPVVAYDLLFSTRPSLGNVRWFGFAH